MTMTPVLESVGQYWNPSTRRVHLLGKGTDTLCDLTPFLPSASLRTQLLQTYGNRPEGAFLLAQTPFPTAEAIWRAEQNSQTLPQWLQRPWERALQQGETMDEGRLDVDPHPNSAHLMACILPMRAQAFGVTYENSAFEREMEGGKQDYRYVYQSVRMRQERCEIFLKGDRWQHFYGPRGAMGLRSDQTNSQGPDGKAKVRQPVLAGVEPELGLVTYSTGEILGYALANDVSGNRIENECTLYLYQAKCFVAAMGIGPWLWLSNEQNNPAIGFSVSIRDAQQNTLYEAKANSRFINAPLKNLITQAASHNPLYAGEFFATGTNIVPGGDVKVIQEGWEVEMHSEQLGRFLQRGTLVNSQNTGNLNYHQLEQEGTS